MADLQSLHTQAKKLILTIRAGLERLETADQVRALPMNATPCSCEAAPPGGWWVAAGCSANRPSPGCSANRPSADCSANRPSWLRGPPDAHLPIIACPAECTITSSQWPGSRTATTATAAAGEPIHWPSLSLLCLLCHGSAALALAMPPAVHLGAVCASCALTGATSLQCIQRH